MGNHWVITDAETLARSMTIIETAKIANLMFPSAQLAPDGTAKQQSDIAFKSLYRRMTEAGRFHNPWFSKHLS